MQRTSWSDQKLLPVQYGWHRSSHQGNNRFPSQGFTSLTQNHTWKIVRHSVLTALLQKLVGESFVSFWGVCGIFFRTRIISGRTKRVSTKGVSMIRAVSGNFPWKLLLKCPKIEEIRPFHGYPFCGYPFWSSSIIKAQKKKSGKISELFS